MRIVLRDKRQLTLPAAVCNALDLKVGDSLDLEIRDGVLVMTPGRKAGLDPLEEIWRIMAESGVTEKELLEGGREIRRELFERDHPNLTRRPVV